MVEMQILQEQYICSSVSLSKLDELLGAKAFVYQRLTGYLPIAC